MSGIKPAHILKDDVRLAADQCRVHRCSLAQVRAAHGATDWRCVLALAQLEADWVAVVNQRLALITLPSLVPTNSPSVFETFPTAIAVWVDPP
jgi:hypothetical protein